MNYIFLRKQSSLLNSFCQAPIRGLIRQKLDGGNINGYFSKPGTIPAMNSEPTDVSVMMPYKIKGTLEESVAKELPRQLLMVDDHHICIPSPAGLPSTRP